jgi:hypothetical protein
MKSIPAVHFRFRSLMGTVFGITTIGIAYRPLPGSLTLSQAAVDLATSRRGSIPLVPL